MATTLTDLRQAIFQRGATPPRPWRYVSEDGIFVGSRTVWMYGAIPLVPIIEEDPSTKLTAASRMRAILENLGKTVEVRIASGWLANHLVQQREFHLETITWADTKLASGWCTPKEAEYQNAALGGIRVPERLVAIGVKLHRDMMPSRRQAISDSFAYVLRPGAPDLSAYATDIAKIRGVFARNGIRAMTEREVQMLKSWASNGISASPTVIEDLTTGQLIVRDPSEGIENRFEMLTVGDTAQLRLPGDAAWVADAITGPDAAFIVSIRAKLTSAGVMRQRIRKQQRKMLAQDRERREAQDMMRIEVEETLSEAAMLEDHYATTKEPMVTDASIVFGRSVGSSGSTADSFRQRMRDDYGFDLNTMSSLQAAAMKETLPCYEGAPTAPALQDMSLSTIANAAMLGFAGLGDEKGFFLGLAGREGVPLYLDPGRSASGLALNQAPVFLIVGDTGSGKTWLAQGVTVQSVLQGRKTVFINPKPRQSLAPMARLLEEMGATVNVVSFSAMQKTPGGLDPFGYADVETAVKLIEKHILEIFGDAIDKFRASRLSKDLSNAIRALQEDPTMRYGMALLPYITDDQLRSGIENYLVDPLFALAFAASPPAGLAVSDGLTLIEFDRPLDLPMPGATTISAPQQMARAAFRLLTRATLEILYRAERGSTLVVDEAYTYLSDPEGLQFLSYLGRTGRSQRVFVTMLTQNIKDVIGNNMSDGMSDGFFGWIGLLATSDAEEATATLGMMNVEPTPELLEDIAIRFRPHDGAPSIGIVQDRDFRRDRVVFGPTPPRAAAAFSTSSKEDA